MRSIDDEVQPVASNKALELPLEPPGGVEYVVRRGFDRR